SVTVPAHERQTGKRAETTPSGSENSNEGQRPPTSGQSPSGHSNPDARTAEILSAADIRRTIDRIAHQILESVGDQPAILVGIPRRGATLAKRLAGRMNEFGAREIPVGALDIT